MFLRRCGCVPVSGERVPLGHGEKGACCLGQAAKRCRRGQQQGTALAGWHSRSISDKLGKLIPGPGALPLGVNTTLQLEPGAAVRSLRSWALREGAQHSTGRQAEAGVQAELLGCPRRGRWMLRLGSYQRLGGRSSSPAWWGRAVPGDSTTTLGWGGSLGRAAVGLPGNGAVVGCKKKEMQTNGFTGSIPFL